MTPQLPLPLSCDPGFAFDQFMVADNAEVLTQLRQWCEDAGDQHVGSIW